MKKRTRLSESNEAERILHGLATMKGYNANVEHGVAKLILMATPIMSNGQSREVDCKHLGAGVYRISLKDWP